MEGSPLPMTVVGAGLCSPWFLSASLFAAVVVIGSDAGVVAVVAAVAVVVLKAAPWSPSNIMLPVAAELFFLAIEKREKPHLGNSAKKSTEPKMSYHQNRR